jgi:hypothetical protein
MKDTRISRQDVQASIWFLEESEVYATVKPYTLAFTPEVQMARENIERKEVLVSISDLRGSEQLFSLDNNGFMVLKFQDHYREVDWDNEGIVKDVHYSEIVSEVERAIPNARCIALHHQVRLNSHRQFDFYLTRLTLLKIRRRHSSFPNSTGKDYTYGQPLRAAHVGKISSINGKYLAEYPAYVHP